MKYAYPAILTFDKHENVYYVNFPDIENCFTDGETIPEALEMGQDALCLMLYDMEECGEVIPAPSDIKDVKCGENEFVELISCDTADYQRYFDNKAVEKTLTIPNWLNVMAERKGINFSAVLQKALKEQLGVTDR